MSLSKIKRKRLKAVDTTIRFDFDSTAIRVPRYDHLTTDVTTLGLPVVAARWRKYINRSA